MTDTDSQAPKKPVRPNLFGPAQATRMADERISVLASLDANPPPKKRKKRGLATGTLVMLSVAAVLFASVIYVFVTQHPAEPDSNADAVAEASPTPAVAPATHASSAENETPSLSLSALAASAPGAEPAAPTSAVIENQPVLSVHNPIAILEGKNEEPAIASHSDANTSSGNKTVAPASQHGTPASLLNALNAPTKVNPSPIKQPTEKAGAHPPEQVAVNTSRATPAKAPSAATTHSSDGKAASTDTDVVLLEALVATSNRQEAKDRAVSKNKPKETARSDKSKNAESEATLTAAQAPEKTKQ